MTDARGTNPLDVTGAATDEDADLIRALLGEEPDPPRRPSASPAPLALPPARRMAEPPATAARTEPAVEPFTATARPASAVAESCATGVRPEAGARALPVSGCFPIDVWRLRPQDVAIDLTIPAPDGTPVYAVATGMLRVTDDNSLELIDAAGTTFRLASVLADSAARGDTGPVPAGRRIGRVRSAPGQRIDGVRLSVTQPDGRAVNPFDVLFRAVDPIELTGSDSLGEDPETMAFDSARAWVTSPSTDVSLLLADPGRP